MTLSDWGSWAAIVAALVAVSLVFFGVYKWVRNNRIKHVLADYLTDGQNLSMQISVSINDQRESLKITMDKWVDRVAKYIKNTYGKDEETLFLGSEGLVSHWGRQFGDLRDQMLPFLDIKLQRLHELMRRK